MRDMYLPIPNEVGMEQCDRDLAVSELGISPDNPHPSDHYPLTKGIRPGLLGISLQSLSCRGMIGRAEVEYDFHKIDFDH